MVFVWVFSKVSTHWYLRSPCVVFRHSLIARSPPHVAIVSPAFAQQTCHTLSLCPSRTAKTQDSVEDDDDPLVDAHAIPRSPIRVLRSDGPRYLLEPAAGCHDPARLEGEARAPGERAKVCLCLTVFRRVFGSGFVWRRRYEARVGAQRVEGRKGLILPPCAAPSREDIPSLDRHHHRAVLATPLASAAFDTRVSSTFLEKKVAWKFPFCLEPKTRQLLCSVGKVKSGASLIISKVAGGARGGAY